MPQLTTQILLPQTILDGVAVIGSPKQAAAYYNAGKSAQTIVYSVTGFSGALELQATLSTTPSDDEWLPIGAFELTEATVIDYTNISGSFAWVRAVVSENSSGTINYIKMSY